MKPCRHPLCPDAGPCRKPRKAKKKYFIKPYSRKRQKDNRKYGKERKKFLEEGDECEAKLPGCTWLATELHHPAGRMGGNLTNVKRCKKVCRNCHQKIELNPEQSKQLGLSESRLTDPLKQQ